MPGGYQVGDKLTLEASKGDLYASEEVTVSSGPNEQCDMVLTVKAEDTPAPGIFVSIAVILGLASIVSLVKFRIK